MLLYTKFFQGLKFVGYFIQNFSRSKFVGFICGLYKAHTPITLLRWVYFRSFVQNLADGRHMSHTPSPIQLADSSAARVGQGGTTEYDRNVFENALSPYMKGSVRVFF